MRSCNSLLMRFVADIMARGLPGGRRNPRGKGGCGGTVLPRPGTTCASGGYKGWGGGGVRASEPSDLCLLDADLRAPSGGFSFSVRSEVSLPLRHSVPQRLSVPRAPCQMVRTNMLIRMVLLVLMALTATMVPPFSNPVSVLVASLASDCGLHRDPPDDLRFVTSDDVVLVAGTRGQVPHGRVCNGKLCAPLSVAQHRSISERLA